MFRVRFQVLRQIVRRRFQRRLRPGRERQQLPRRFGALGFELETGGASSRTTWAFVPPTPNELTPARRGVSPCRPVRQSGVDDKRAIRQSRCAGWARRKCRVGGSSLCFSASAVLISPVTPDAASRWPMLGLTEPRAQKPTLSVSCAGRLWSARRLQWGRPAASPCRAPRHKRSSRQQTPAIVLRLRNRLRLSRRRSGAV